MLDFTHPNVVFSNTKTIIESGKRAVVGTTGLTETQLQELDELSRANNTGVLVCPNLPIGAVLNDAVAAQASKYLNEVEIIEYHHPYKADAPSGTAIKTADMIHEVTPSINDHFGDFKQTELIDGAKGGITKIFRFIRYVWIVILHLKKY